MLSGGELQVFLTRRCLPEVGLRISSIICSVIRRYVGGKHKGDLGLPLMFNFKSVFSVQKLANKSELQDCLVQNGVGGLFGF